MEKIPAEIFGYILREVPVKFAETVLQEPTTYSGGNPAGATEGIPPKTYTGITGGMPVKLQRNI